MKLNIGAGDQKISGFVTIDYDANCNPDYVLDIERQPLPFEDNTVDEVIIHHVMEHLGDGFFYFLQELYRVCRHGAQIDVLVPHHRHDHFLNDPTHRRPITVEGMKLFSRKYNDACREQGARASRLAYHYGVDYEIVSMQDIPDPRYIEIFDGKEANHVLRYIHEHNNIVMEVHFKWVVIKEYD